KISSDLGVCCFSPKDPNFKSFQRISKSSGIPTSFMVEVNDPTMKGVMLSNTGALVIPVINAEAYKNAKKEEPVFIEKKEPVPSELLCLICGDIMVDAVVIPCCGSSYCDDCIRSLLLDSDTHTCPTCHQSEVSPDSLVAKTLLRQVTFCSRLHEHLLVVYEKSKRY
uniref:RING-type domain-containing protein n=1 Tax=Erpetoichthys calabaricus TaxID=27687 RepID=A0A8C4SW61_ERPCA